MPAMQHGGTRLPDAREEGAPPTEVRRSGAPLTEAQSGLWYAQRLDPGNPIFNVAHAIEINGALDAEAFSRAVDETVLEADSLALRIFETPDGPRQSVDDAFRARLEHFDVSASKDPMAAARAAMLADLRTPVDPACDRLAANKLFRLGPERYVWYLRVHHLAIDGYGMTLFTDRVGELYSDCVGERRSRHSRYAGALPPFELVLAEDAAYRALPRRTADAAFWRNTFTPLPAVSGLAAGRAVTGRECHRVEAAVAPRVAAAVRTLADACRLPWPDVLTTLVALYCQRMTGAAEAVVGVPHMGRFGSRAARVPAMVMNVLPLRVALDEERPLTELCKAVSALLAHARRHGRYRSEQLRRDLGLLGGERRLYGSMINVLPFDRPPRLQGLETRVEVLATGPVDDITFTFRGDAAASLSLEIESNPNLYSRAGTEAHAARLAAFLDAALGPGSLGVESLDAALRTESLLNVATASPAEIRRVIVDCNSTEHAVPDTTLGAMLETVMRRTPGAEALVFGSASLTYSELDARTAALAVELSDRGIGTDDIVAVALLRSVELVVALVGVLRAGAAYLPLDPTHPPERLQRLGAAAGARCVLCDAGTTDVWADAAAVLPASAWPRRTTERPSGAARPDSAAYVIFTSGSTGEPKGVVVEHRAIVNRLEWMRVHYGFDASDRILHKTPTTFDVSVWELFLPLIAGATLVVARPGEHRDPRALAALIRAQRITAVHFVPSMLAAFLADPASAGLELDRVFCSGEELSAELRDRFHARIGAELHNLYGPTEAAVDVSYWPAGAGDRSAPVPIGFPVWNTRLYVLDDRLRPVPPGVAGHLLIGGVQLARGYLGRPDLTAERFIPDPFVAGARMYRTGDLAVRRDDGAVVFLGRSDDQIKVRGLRIEPGEIESAVQSSGLVRRAGVIAREDRAGVRRIVAYVVPAQGYDAERLRRHLGMRLPDYMLPGAIVALDELPVTANGKLDRTALPAPRFAEAGGRPARTATEAAVAELFADVLELSAMPGADGDFFTLGGDSLLALQLMLGVQRRWGRDPGLGTLFARPTVAALAAAIDEDAAEAGGLAADHGLAPLLELAPGDAARPPLFVVHPAGGIAWCYRPLARALASHDGDRIGGRAGDGAGRTGGAGRAGHAVYGLQAAALDPNAAVPPSIDALAADYVERIRRVRPSGPYHLAGWSVGGIIVHAMAVRLRRLGHAVGLLAALDAYPADCWRAEPEPDEAAALRALLVIAGYDPDRHTDLVTRGDIVGFLRRGGSPLGGLPERTLDGVIRVVTSTNRLVRGHFHQRYDGVLTHVRAALDHADGKLSPDSWKPYVAALDVVDVPYTHAELPGSDATARIAPALAARLDALERADGDRPCS